MKYSINIFFSISLFFSGASAATSQDKLDSMANLKLAMLTLSEKQTFRIKSAQADKQASSKSIKAKGTKRAKPQIFHYPSNCLKWSAAQINRKASTHRESISKYSRLNRVDSNLIKSIITAESCFRVKALSGKGAKGLMQLIPATGKRFGVKNLYNPDQNIRGGAKYLKFLLDRYKGNLKKTIAAYNAGEGAVDKYKGIPPYRETKNYVENVLKIYRMLAPKKRPSMNRAHGSSKIRSKPGRQGWQYNRRLAPHLYKH